MAVEDPKPGEKRRLPVLQARDEPPAGEPPEPDRPAWRRVSLGVTATFLAWLVLFSLVAALDGQLRPAADDPGVRSMPAFVVLAGYVVAFLVGAFAGGALAGRLGAARDGRREGAITGAAAAALAWLVALGQGAPGGALVWGLLLVILGSLGAWGGSLGGRVGVRLRGGGG